MAKTRKMRKITKAKGKRGRKPIFSGEQKRVLLRMIRAALKENIRGVSSHALLRVDRQDELR